ncbi:hypothetical protein AX16_003982 [Volvariella volvacea WC 439]|nr:hypothetical protein AX16_003982 [Volvariella volvacea WC 439]
MAHHVAANSSQCGNRAPGRRYAVPPNAPTPSTQVRSTDPFYGQEKVARMCHRFITHLFACPELPPNAQQTTNFPMHARLPYFIAYALHRTKLHQSVVTASLILLQRLKARFPTARGSSGHRLFISAFMISSKVICDDTYSNKSWTIVAQNMFSLREINQMEREMCNYLDWELTVDKAMLDNFSSYLDRYFSIDREQEVAKYDISQISKRMRVASPSSSTPIPGSNDTTTSIPIGSRGSSPSRPSASRSSSRSTSRDYPATPSPSYSASTSPASTAPPSTPPSSVDYTTAIASDDASPPFQCIATAQEASEAERSANHPLKNDMFAHASAGAW